MLKITKRHLPHWELEEVLYYVTWHTRNSELAPNERSIILSQIKEAHNRFYCLHAAVIMPDHVHLILIPKQGVTVSRITKGIKGVSARRINALRGATGTSLWQAESWDRIPRNEHEVKEKFEYMLLNPLKAGLTDDPWSYPWWYLNADVGK